MAKAVAQPRLYRLVWRWHFYAGLIVAPFLLILAVTGSIYLFNDELNDLLYPAQRFVAPHGTNVPVSRMVRAALAAHPGGASRIDMPAAPDRPAVVFVQPKEGPGLRVSVDPGSGRVLGSIVYGRTLVGFADEMHGSLTIGTIGDRIVELAACWALFLIASGLYLWWPRGRRGLGGILYPRLSAGGRIVWRDVHAVTGVWTMLLIAFLLITGLPWAGVQGDLLQKVSAAAGVGYPPAHFTHNAPSSMPMKQALGSAPWTLEAMPMPMSGPSPAHAGHAGHGDAGAVHDAAALDGLDRVTADLAGRYDLAGGYRLFLPVGERGVYTAYTYPDRAEGQRTLYFDRWSGRLIREVDFADYGWVGRATELGVQIHLGNYWGRANQIVMLLPCIGIVTLVMSGFVMWWKRRPLGRLGAPPVLAGTPLRGFATLSVVAGLLLPLLGASMLVVLLIDTLAVRWRSSRQSFA
jgi:uncharacterized iron-regulated membrane protein